MSLAARNPAFEGMHNAASTSVSGYSRHPNPMVAAIMTGIMQDFSSPALAHGNNPISQTVAKAAGMPKDTGYSVA